MPIPKLPTDQDPTTGTGGGASGGGSTPTGSGAFSTKAKIILGAFVVVMIAVIIYKAKH